MSINEDKWQYSTYSKINPKVKNYFPFPNPRKGQLEIISEIDEAISKGYKFIILEAGTGTGKSAIAATLALMAKDAYILTVTKQLQDQYLDDFERFNFKLIKGKANYPCIALKEKGVEKNCDEGQCEMVSFKCKYRRDIGDLADCLNNECCPYRLDKAVAMDSNVVISNYAYAFLEFNNVKDFKKRELMICDEAHNLEDSIMGLVSLEFNRTDLKNEIDFDLTDDEIYQLETGDYFSWITFIEKIQAKYIEKRDEYEKLVLVKPYIKPVLNTIKNRISDMGRFMASFEENPENWIFDWDEYTESVQFKPLKVDEYARNLLFSNCDICLLMSATILDWEKFAEYLGIDHSEIYPIRQESPFDNSRNPIRSYENYDLSYKKIKDNAPLTLPIIRDILDEHAGDKGIIHTVSYKCKEFLMDELNNSRLIDHETENRSEILGEFEQSPEPLVLISPSMNEGVDLPDDKCRFQIIYKIPYPNYADRLTMIRANLDQSWYKYKACVSLIQTYGRGMRSENDYCKTYFIDNRLKEFIEEDSKTYGFIPESFKKAIDFELEKDDESDDLGDDFGFVTANKL